MTRIKKVCDDCKKEVNHVVRFNNKVLCRFCLNKIDTIPRSIGVPCIKAEEFLKRIYYILPDSGMKVCIHIPKVLWGKKLRLVIVDD